MGRETTCSFKFGKLKENNHNDKNVCLLLNILQNVSVVQALLPPMRKVGREYYRFTNL